MHTTTLFGLVAAAATAAAQSSGFMGNGTVMTTTVVTALTTFCPKPTVVTFNDVCYTVTTPTTLTITNCPCTITTAMPAPTPMGTGGMYTAPMAPSAKPTYAVSGAADRQSQVGFVMALGAVAAGFAIL